MGVLNFLLCKLCFLRDNDVIESDFNFQKNVANVRNYAQIEWLENNFVLKNFLCKELAEKLRQLVLSIDYTVSLEGSY